MGLGAVGNGASGAGGVGSLGLVDLTLWCCWARCPKIVFFGVGTISSHVGVCETIKGVTVSCFNGIQPCLLDWEAKTSMVEAHGCACQMLLSGIKLSNRKMLLDLIER